MEAKPCDNLMNEAVEITNFRIPVILQAPVIARCKHRKKSKKPRSYHNDRGTETNTKN